MIDIVDDVFVEVVEGILLLACDGLESLALLDDWRVDQDFGDSAATCHGSLTS